MKGTREFLLWDESKSSLCFIVWIFLSIKQCFAAFMEITQQKGKNFNVVETDRK
jgi:hypothetical protein